MRCFTFTGILIISESEVKINRLANKNFEQDSDKNREPGGFLEKDRRAKEMKKKYRVTIDYEIEIAEKIDFTGESIRPENRDKLQQIVDAFLANPGELREFIKFRIFPYDLYSDTPGSDIVEALQVMSVDEICNSLSHMLKPETASYFLSILSWSGLYTGTDEDFVKELGLLLGHFDYLIPLRASFKEINGNIEMNDNEQEENEDQEAIMEGVLVIGQMSPTGKILPLPCLRMQTCRFSRDK